MIREESWRWGKRPAPLLPQTLRRALGQVSLPKWLTRDLRLPEGATPISLDGSVWKLNDKVPGRVFQYLIGLISYRRFDIENVTVIREWSDEHPELNKWPTRVRNALQQAGLFEQGRFGRLTYGELLAIPGLGAKSVLEFALIAEQASSRGSAALSRAQQEALLTACDEPWAERVRADDPRFRDIAPAYDGTLAELFEDALANPQGERSLRVAESLANLRARVIEIDQQPLEVALRSLLVAERVPERDVEITLHRMGWRGGAPASLREVGDAHGITRERVRQVVNRSLRGMGPRYLPPLERALQVLQSEGPLPVETAAELLVVRRISTVPFHPAGVKKAAEVFGYEAGLRLMSEEGINYVCRPDEVGVGLILSVARREAGKVGASNVEELHARLVARGELCSEKVIRRLLESSPRIRFLTRDWFWMPDIPPARNRLRNTTRLMLSVTPRLPLQSVRHGLRRRYRWRGIDVVPPLDILRAFYRGHPEFGIDDEDIVTCTEELDYRKELGDAERMFVEVLHGIPSGLSDRAELETAVIGRGVNPSTFAVFTSFSPILDHPATNVWCLRGHDVDPTAVEALRDIVATRPRERRTIDYGWEEDGTLSVRTIVGNISSPVIAIPSPVSRYVSACQFPATTQDGSNVGTVVVDERGNSWGYGPFLRRRGADVGDVLTIGFDLAAERVILVLADEADLVEM